MRHYFMVDFVWMVLEAQKELDKKCGIQNQVKIESSWFRHFFCAKRSLLSGHPTENSKICPFRYVPLRFIITFHRGGKRAVHSVLVKYVIFEKISSDPRKYRSEVRLAIHNGHHRDPVLDTVFGHFWKTYDKKWFCSARVDLWGNVTLSDVGSIQKVLFFGIICLFSKKFSGLDHLTADTRTYLTVASRPCRHGGSSRHKYIKTLWDDATSSSDSPWYFRSSSGTQDLNNSLHDFIAVTELIQWQKYCAGL